MQTYATVYVTVESFTFNATCAALTVQWRSQKFGLVCIKCRLTLEITER